MPRGINAYDESRLQGRNVANANSSNIVAPGIVTDGLVLHLDAGNYQSYPISGTTCYDLSERGNNGTLDSGVGYLRDGGGVFDFNGTTEKITLLAGPDFAYGTGDFAIDGWFNNQLTLPAYGSTLFSQTISGSNYFWIYLGDNTPTPTNKVGFTFSGNTILSSTTFTSNTWNHFAVTRLKSNVTVYLNAVAGTPGSSANDFTNTTYVPTIAQYTHSSGNRFTGYIGPIRVYKNKGLTPLEVQQNFNATRARFNV